MLYTDTGHVPFMRFLRLLLGVAAFLCGLVVMAQPCAVSIAAAAGPHCPWSSVPLSVSSNTGVAPYSYTWSVTGGGGQLAGASGATPTLQLPGAGPVQVQVQLSVTDANGCTATSSVLSVPVSAPTGILQAALGGSALTHDFDYGPSLPTYDLCQAPAPGSTTFTFTGLSSGATVLRVNLGAGFVPAALPMSSNFGVGLDTVQYILQDPSTLCVDTLSVGVLVGSPNVTYTMSVAASQTPFRGCVGDSVEFTINTSQGFQPGTGYIIAYNDNGYVPVDTLFPDTQVFSFWREFNGTSCPYNVGAIQHTYDLQVRTIYGCSEDFASGNASSIFISDVPNAVLAASTQNVCLGSGPVAFDNQSTGMWIQGNNCVAAPNFYYEVLNGTQGTHWNPANNLGNANSAPANPGAWANGSDPLSLNFLQTGQYTVRLYAGGNGSCPVDHADVTVCVDAPRDVGFTMTSNPTCVPVLVNLSDTTDWAGACGTQAYTWTVTPLNLFCGGPAPAIQVPAVAAPQFTITVPGEYRVRMQVNTPCGVRMQEQTITVYGPPTGTLAALPPTPCVGAVVPLSSTASGCGDPGFQTQYTVTGGGVINGSEVEVTGAGPITIALQGQNQCTSGWVQLGTQTISGQAIPDPPTATIAPALVCAGATVTVTVDPQPGVTDYSISTPAGTVAGTTTTFTATDAMNGATITVTAGPAGCGRTQNYTLAVQPISPVQIIAAPVPICAGGTVSLMASGAGTSYEWFALAGTPLGVGPSITVAPTSDLTVVLVDSIAGCASADTLLVPVNPLPAVVAPPAITLCADGTPYTLPTLPLGGDYRSDHTAFAEPGLVTPTAGVADAVPITLIVTDANACVDSVLFSITINNASGAADAGPDMALCWNGSAVNFTGTGAWLDEAPHFVGGTFVPALAQPQTYALEVCATVCVNLCDQVEVIVHDTVAVQLPPNAAFCIGDAAVDFDAGPFDGVWSGSLFVTVDGLWDNPSATDGEHTLVYTMTDPVTQCETVGSLAVTVNPPPVAAIDPMAPCAGQPMTLANNSTGSSWVWSIPGVADLTGQWPQHTFTDYGWHAVTVVAIDGNDCSDTATVQVFVDMAPVVDVAWTVLDSCGEGLVQAVNQPFAGAQHAWSQNGVLVSTAEQPPLFVLPAPLLNDTVYDLAYVTWNDCDSLTQLFQVTVRPEPFAAIGVVAPTICLNDSITISDQSYGGIDSVLVQWGDVAYTTSMDSVLHHQYPAPGEYTITYTAYGPCGSQSTATASVEVLPNEVQALMGLVAEDVCAGTAFFVENISVGDTAVVIYVNGESSTLFPGGWFTVDEPGEHTIMLVAFGCGVDTVYRTISVDPLPMITLPDDLTVCDGDVVQFGVAGVGLVGVVWDFGDQESSSLVAPTHTFPGPSTYTVTVAVQDQANLCPSSDQLSVTVRPTPVAAFVPDTTAFCLPYTLDLTNTAQPGADYQWLVDGEVHSYAVQAPGVLFTTPGPHTITLIAAFANTPCADTTHITVFGNDTPTASFVLAPVDTCASTVQVLGQNTSTPGASATWYINAELVSNTPELDVSFTGVPGAHVVELVATAPGGCEARASDTFVLAPRPEAEFDWGPLACSSMALDINNTSTNGVLWNWNWGADGHSFFTTPRNIVFDTAGVYSISLLVTGANTCTDTLVRSVTVLPTPAVDHIRSAPVDTECGRTWLWVDAPPGSASVWELPNGQYEPGDSIQFDLGPYACAPQVCVAITAASCTQDLCTQSIDFTPCDGVFAPNAFTPDGDGFNDVFLPVLVVRSLPYELSIFDRWGRQVFRTTDPDKGWNGVYDGKLVQLGVYNWRLEAKNTCGGDEKTYQGHVTVVR